MVTRPTLAVTITLGLWLAGCRQPAQPRASAALVERTHPSMGTEIRLTAWATDRTAAEAAFGEVFGEFDRLEDLMSVWRDGSDIASPQRCRRGSSGPCQPRRTRRAGDRESGQRVDERHVRRHLRRARRPLEVRYQNKDNTVPDPREVAKRLTLIDYRDLEVDEKAGTAFLRRKGMRVNLGGIGKGYAVDRAVEILRKRGLENFMIQAGGDLYVSVRRATGRGASASAIRAAPRTNLRGPRPVKRHVQHVGRLRALLSQGRSPLSPHHRRPRGAARAGVPQRDAGDRSRGDRRRARQGRVHPGAGAGMALIDGCRTWRASS